MPIPKETFNDEGVRISIRPIFFFIGVIIVREERLPIVGGVTIEGNPKKICNTTERFP